MNRDDDEPVFKELHVMQQQARANEHIFGGVLDRAHYEAASEAAMQTTCPHCDVIAKPLPAAGYRWVIEEHHESHCPRYVDDGDAVLYPPDW